MKRRLLIGEAAVLTTLALLLVPAGVLVAAAFYFGLTMLAVLLVLVAAWPLVDGWREPPD